MGENQLLVDTDVLIAYLNHRAYRSYLESARYRVYYSAITKKELLSKRGLKASERQAILTLLKRFRLIRIDRRVTDEYSRLRIRYPSLAKGDALIGASALARKLPLLTQNLRHFCVIQGLVLLPVEVKRLRSQNPQ
ncbi:MAG: PIN domain-containing protein [Deltaproteobacteria bacterium]|nr:PIN domain-containing protein [Deltaproteobacteria bacterium]MBI3066434.1 PIN domain-containing protein [Deltaproteobacteria bacterium]